MAPSLETVRKTPSAITDRSSMAKDAINMSKAVSGGAFSCSNGKEASVNGDPLLGPWSQAVRHARRYIGEEDSSSPPVAPQELSISLVRRPFGVIGRPWDSGARNSIMSA